MNYKVYFNNNKATHCEMVSNRHDAADYVTVNNEKIIKSLVVNALSEKEALVIGTSLANKLLNT